MLRPVLVAFVLSTFGVASVVAQTQSAAPAKAAEKSTLKVPSEFRRKIVNGEVQYCTKRTTIGTRFPKLTCVNEDGLRAMLEQRALDQDELRSKQSVCATATACGGT